MSREALFSLIQGLTQHEKRYVRLHFERQPQGKDGQLLRLYRLLEGEPHYDEAAVKRRLAGDALGRQYAVYKNLLYHALLRGLQAYRYEQGPAMAVRSGLDKVEILVEKGLHAAALKMLRRTRAMAEEFSQHSHLIELLNWERRILRYLNPLGYLDELPRIEAYERRMMATVQQEAEAMRIYDRLFAWVQVERRMEKAQIAQQFAAIGERLDALEAVAVPTFGTVATLLNARALYRQMQGDYGGMAAAYAAMVAHWDAHPKVKAADPQRYARLQVAWLNSLLAAGKIGQHLPDIRALRRMPIQGSTDQARTVFQSYNLELLWLMDQRDVAAALRFLPSFEQKLPELRPHLDGLRLASFFLNAAILFSRAGDYGQARRWAGRLPEAADLPDDNAVVRSAQLVVLVCHCALGDLEEAESLLAAMGRRMQSRDADWEFGRVALHWIKRMLPKWGLPEMDALRQGFHAALLELGAKAQPAPLVMDVLLQWTGG